MGGGQVEGFDVDVLNAIGEKRGFKVKFLVTPWEGIFETVTSGSRDIISTALVITPERQKIVDFSDPYFTSGRMAVVVDPSLKSFEQLRGKRFVTQAGTSNMPILENFLGSKENITGIDTQYQEIKALLSGEADVAFDDSGVMQYYIAQDKSKSLHAIPYNDYPGDEFGFAVKPGRTDLLNEINMGLKEIKADGTYQKIYNKYFATSAE